VDNRSSQTGADPAGWPGGVRLAPGVHVPEAALRFQFSSSTGPGGQNVNKKATKAQLRVAVVDLGLPMDAADRLRTLAGAAMIEGDQLLIASDEHRSQGRNKDECVDRLAGLVARAMVRPKKRRPTKPTKGSKTRRLVEKKVRGEIKRGRRGGGEAE
jgi:ribosome-associated protein